MANAGLGAVHGFAGTIGGIFKNASHGAICARLLPCVIEANLSALRERMPQSPVLERYEKIAQILTGNASAKADDCIVWTRDISTAMNIAPLSAFGISENDFSDIVNSAKKSSSMKGNPIGLMEEELRVILEKAL